MSYICSGCIGDEVLAELIAQEATDDNPCEYCEDSSPTVTVWFVAEQCDEVLSTFYEDSSRTVAVIVHGREPAGKSLQDTICDLLDCSEKAVEDVADALLSMWYDRDSGEYKYGDDDPWFVLRSKFDSPLTSAWANIESSLRGEARYLNPKVVEFFQSVFAGLHGDVAVNGSPVLVNVGPGQPIEALFRARVFQSDEGLYNALEHPERFLGSPAVGVGGAGRMNALGQPAFYGATDIATALAEVRPPVGSSVVTAQFNIMKPLKLLDFRLVRNIELYGSESLFDPKTKENAHRRDFLRMLCEKIVVPVMPESQDRDYLITQVLADFLAMYPSETISGIIYPSVQRKAESDDPSGSNVVLFSRACVVDNANAREKTADVEIWDYEEDGPGRYFNPTIVYRPIESQLGFWRSGFHPAPTLQLTRNSIEIHRVDSVDIKTTAAPVHVIDRSNNKAF